VHRASVHSASVCGRRRNYRFRQNELLTVYSQNSGTETLADFREGSEGARASLCRRLQKTSDMFPGQIYHINAVAAGASLLHTGWGAYSAPSDSFAKSGGFSSERGEKSRKDGAGRQRKGGQMGMRRDKEYGELGRWRNDREGRQGRGGKMREASLAWPLPHNTQDSPLCRNTVVAYAMRPHKAALTSFLYSPHSDTSLHRFPLPLTLPT